MTDGDLHRPARRPAPHGEDRGQGEQAEHAGERAVAELDPLVEALGLLDGRRDRAVDALGPGRAPEAAARDPHEPAGHDDRDLGHEVGQQDRGQPPGTDGRGLSAVGSVVLELVLVLVTGSRLRLAPQASTGWVAQSDQRKVRLASRPATAPHTASTAHCASGQPPSTRARRIASPSAPEGRAAATPPRMPGSACGGSQQSQPQQQHPHEVRDGEHGLGAQGPGEQQGQRHEARAARAAGSARPAPARSAGAGRRVRGRGHRGRAPGRRAPRAPRGPWRPAGRPVRAAWFRAGAAPRSAGRSRCRWPGR